MTLFLLIVIRLSFVFFGMGLLISLQRRHSISRYKTDILRDRRQGKRLTKKGIEVVTRYDMQQVVGFILLIMLSIALTS